MNPKVFDGQFKFSPYIPYDASVNPILTGYTTHPLGNCETRDARSQS